MTKHIVFFTVITTFLISASGCGLRLVDLQPVDVTQIDESNAPVEVTAEGKRSINARGVLIGTTQAFPYDWLLWRVTRLPWIRSTSGELVLLDTGMGNMAHVSLDIVSKSGYPAHLGDPTNFTYVKSLAIGQMVASDILAIIETKQWQFHVLGLPIYRMCGWALGMPLLEQASFLAFNNQTAEVTIGFEEFKSWPELSWQSYDLINRKGMPYVSLPIAGVPTELVADSGGGPRLILNSKHWKAISRHVEVTRHWVTSYPTWGRSQEVDAYRVSQLMLGPVELRDEVIWVKQGDSETTGPGLLGLGPFKDAVVVWDFNRHRLWIGCKTNGQVR